MPRPSPSGTVRRMSIAGAPPCPKNGCDGHLHREFLSGLNQSTSQMMRLGGMALIVGPILFGAPVFIDYVVRQTAGMGGMVGALIGLAVPVIAGVLLLRYRKQRMSNRTEQQRCNKCGEVVSA